MIDGWTVVRYAPGGWPSHPDEDLPPDGARVELWRHGGRWLGTKGTARRVIMDSGHESATIFGRDMTFSLGDPPDGMPEPSMPSGVVWRLIEEEEEKSQ